MASQCSQTVWKRDECGFVTTTSNDERAIGIGPGGVPGPPRAWAYAVAVALAQAGVPAARESRSVARAGPSTTGCVARRTLKEARRGSLHNNTTRRLSLRSRGSLRPRLLPLCLPTVGWHDYLHSLSLSMLVASVTALYTATGGASWTASTNWLTGDPCSDSWMGVTCTPGDCTAISCNVLEM